MIEEYLKEKGIRKQIISKNQVLLKPGKTTTKAFYVKSGLLRSYIIDERGKIHNFMFAPEGWIISDLHSNALSTPTDFYIDTIEDSQIYQFDIEDFINSNLDEKQVIQKLFRRIAFMKKRIILLMSATAAERYQHFLETYPQLTSRIPLKMIASYLGITPEALSNIRRKKG